MAISAYKSVAVAVRKTVFCSLTFICPLNIVVLAASFETELLAATVYLVDKNA